MALDRALKPVRAYEMSLSFMSTRLKHDVAVTESTRLVNKHMPSAASPELKHGTAAN